MKKNIKTALVVVAHRDDEVLGCGGTIAKLIDENYKVYAISMTDGVTSRAKYSKKQIENSMSYEAVAFVEQINVGEINIQFEQRSLQTAYVINEIRRQTGVKFLDD